jgi:FkbM family methyltransferase
MGRRLGIVAAVLLAVACRGRAERGENAPAATPAAPAGTPASGSPARILSEKPLYSQSNEEIVIRSFFRDRRDGVFLDVGCASPIVNSNTYYLEHHLGWSGIAVDALAEYAEAWKAKRPRSQFFGMLVSDHADTMDRFYRSELRGISSVNPDRTGPGGDLVKSEEIRVPTTTLNKLLERQGVTRIDFLSMDIEGHELPALAGFDIDRYKPQLACVEAKPENREKLMKYFADHGYRRLKRYIAYDSVNYYFAPGAAD